MIPNRARGRICIAAAPRLSDQEPHRRRLASAANRGRVALPRTPTPSAANCGPAVSFAHNGQLAGVKLPAARPPSPDRHHRQRTRLRWPRRTRGALERLCPRRAASTPPCLRSSAAFETRRLQRPAQRRTHARRSTGALGGDAARPFSAGKRPRFDEDFQVDFAPRPR